MFTMPPAHALRHCSYNPTYTTEALNRRSHLCIDDRAVRIYVHHQYRQQLRAVPTCKLIQTEKTVANAEVKARAGAA